jgi:hypothetical protein
LLLFDMQHVDSKEFFYGNYDMEISAGESRTRQEKFTDEISNFITEYIRLISFLMLPVYAAFSRFIFRKSGLNFMEHIALFCYCHAHPLWLTILGGILFKNTGINLSVYLFPISLIYTLWFFMDYFKVYMPWKRLLKSILVQVYSLLTLGIIGGVTAIIYVISTQS